MKELGWKLVNLVLYGHFWIAGAALAMYLQSGLLLTGRLVASRAALTVASGTLALYALHRLVGLRRVRPYQDRGRFRIIARFRHHIRVYLIAFGGAAGIGFLGLPGYLQSTMALPCLLALAYVLPLFGEGRRLRDLHYLKIFLIASAWAWLTAAVPAREAGLLGTFPAWLLIAERACFIFAITLPFDIRDQDIDDFTGVKTIPGTLGVSRAKSLAGGLLLAATALAGLNAFLGSYTPPVFFALIGSFALAAGLILRARGTETDYYYTGWIDGTMILQFLLVSLVG